MAQSTIPTKQLPITTTVDVPGIDTQIPTEKAVRDALGAISTVTSIVNAGAALYTYFICI